MMQLVYLLLGFFLIVLRLDRILVLNTTFGFSQWEGGMITLPSNINILFRSQPIEKEHRLCETVMMSSPWLQCTYSIREGADAAEMDGILEEMVIPPKSCPKICQGLGKGCYLKITELIQSRGTWSALAVGCGNCGYYSYFSDRP